MKGLIHSLILALLFGTTMPLQAADTEEAASGEPPAGNTQATDMRGVPPDPAVAAIEALKLANPEGEQLTLNAGGEEVFGLFMSAIGSQQGGLLLLHDRGAHPDSPGVIHPLRTRLPTHGWATLSVALPVPEEDGLTPEWLERTQALISSAINTLQQRGSDAIVISGHGLGAFAATDYLAAGDNLSVQGLILIGMDGRSNEDPRLDGAALLARVRPPILDIYAERDHRGVLESLSRRAAAAARRDGAEETAHSRYRDIARDYSDRKGRSVGYRQVQIPAADHDFTGHEEQLVRRIRGWLKRHVADR